MPSVHRVRQEENKRKNLKRLVEKLAVLKSDLWIEKHKLAAFDAKLSLTHKAILDAKMTYVTLRKVADEKSHELHDVEQKMLKQAFHGETNLRNYDALLAELPSVSSELESMDDVSSTKEYQELLQNFLRQRNVSPWTLEKRQYLHSLQEDENRLEITKRQVAALDQKIEDKRRKLVQHHEYPFQKFCFTLANFTRNHQSLRELLKKEEAINKDLKARVTNIENNLNESGVSCGTGIFHPSLIHAKSTLASEANIQVPRSGAVAIISNGRVDGETMFLEKSLSDQVSETSDVLVLDDVDNFTLSSLEEECDTSERGSLTRVERANRSLCAIIDGESTADEKDSSKDGDKSSCSFFNNFNALLGSSFERNPFGF